MGNVVLNEHRKGNSAQNYDHWLEQNPDLHSKEILSENKIFRVASYKFNGRNLILKAFFKRESETVEEYIKAFENFNSQVDKYRINHLIPIKILKIRDSTSFVVGYRQKMAQTLEDIIASKPPPDQLKKKWIIYQMIEAVMTVHRKLNFFHGHIRASNFLLTSYGYLMLTDFAFYKPIYMFQDSEQGLTKFRLFYGSSIERCSIAPEKMKETGDSKEINNLSTAIFSMFRTKSDEQDNPTLHKAIPIKPKAFVATENRHRNLELDQQELNNIENIVELQKMDIFSLGITILELLSDGKVHISYEDLLKLKRNELSLDKQIDQACSKLEDSQLISDLLKKMLSCDPASRPEINSVSEQWRKLVDTDVYSLLWHCVSAFSTVSFHLPDQRISLIHQIVRFIESEVRGSSCELKVGLPKCLESFQPLNIFKSLLKKEIIYKADIEEGCLLEKIINSSEKEEQVDSEEEIMNNDEDRRREFFVPFKAKKSSSMRVSKAIMPRLEKVLCPPLWDRSMMNLISIRLQGNRLTEAQIASNHFQDLLTEYKKNQFLREIRLKENNDHYHKFSMLISLIYSCVRGCKYTASKLLGVEIIMFIAKESSDQVRLERVMPYLISLLNDPDVSVAKYVFNSLIDLFYLFIDPFQTQEQISYNQIIIETFVNNIEASRMRNTFFRRLPEIFSICQWLDVHIRRITQKQSQATFKKVITTIKENYGKFTSSQIREFVVHMPETMWPDMFEFFISFLNSEKILGLEKLVQITRMESDAHRRQIDTIDSCVQSALQENGLSLYFAIKYFTNRKLCTVGLAKKIGPFVIHPHMWVREQAKQYIAMSLEENPPTRIFFLYREIFEPPFPLKIEDMQNEHLLPEPLSVSQVDFQQRVVKVEGKVGLTLNKFRDYLSTVKNAKLYPITSEEEIEQSNSQFKSMSQNRVEAMLFSQYIKKVLYEIFETNLLYYVGISKTMVKADIKERKEAMAEYQDVLKQFTYFNIDDSCITQEKKDFFESLLMLVNSNFEKFLIKYTNGREDKAAVFNKIKVSENLYSIMDVLYKFEQFQVKQTMRLGEYTRKSGEPTRVSRPRGQLITEIYEHRDMITSLQSIADNLLISASYDGTLRVFNTNKIQMNITASSEAAYEINSEQSEERVKINSIAAFDNTYTVAAGTNKGQIRILRAERMRPMELNRSSRPDNTQIMKYSVGGEIEKIITLKNHKMNECFCFVTVEGNLGVQDIRAKSKTMVCNLGKERGVPKCLTLSPLGPSLFIGTLDGYLLTYDIRCNIVSDIRQLHRDQVPVSITGIHSTPEFKDYKPLFYLTYPSKNYQFSLFDLYSDSQQLMPEKHYSTCEQEQILTVPTIVNKSKEENFKLGSNSLVQKLYYKQLPDFNRNFKILNYVSDLLTIKENKIKEIWKDRCKYRYSQIYSIYNKKSLPFLETLAGGIMTNLNPCIPNLSELKNDYNLTLLVDRRQTKDYQEIEKIVTEKPSNIYSFLEEANEEYLTCCKVLPNMVAVGGWNSVIKLYK